MLALVACENSGTPAPEPAASLLPPAPPRPPSLLFLPDGGDVVLEGTRPPLAGPPSGRCPAEMVDVAGRFCIDRYEASMVDARLGRELSPYFAPSRGHVLAALQAFASEPPRPAPRLPLPPEFQTTERFAARAVSRSGVVPSGYLSGPLAREACETAGKRLCKPDEWLMACRGQAGQRFPYGNEFRPGACNVFRDTHPAVAVYGDASKNHLDPRLNLVADGSGPLLRRTGESPRCRSDWGGDAVFDMVGNLDEWLDDPGGVFAGGFFARATRDGCDARIESHAFEYSDYSLGVRCCR